MATFNWTTLTNGQVVAFNPLVDVLNFDDATISAANIELNSNDGVTDFIVSYGGKTVTFLGAPLAVTTSNVTFANGSKLVIGDDTTGTVNDDAPNTLTGGSGDDLLIGLGGADSILGGGGNDIIPMIEGNTGTWGNDTIDGGTGTDEIGFSDASGFGVNVNLATGFATGGDGSPGSTLTLISIETVFGTGLADTLTGGSADELFAGQAGSDIITGGAGIDTLDYLDSPTRVIVNMSDSTTIVTGGNTVQPGTALDGWGPAASNTDIISGMENVLGSFFNDFILGNDSANRLEGDAGDDVLWQTRGADHLDGGTGTDRLTFNGNGIAYGGAVGVNVNLAAGISDYDTNDAGNPLGTLVSIEGVTGTSGNDNFVGGDSTQATDPFNNPAEFFQPQGGNDTITGATGNGFVTRADYFNSTSAITANLGTGTVSDGFGGTDILVRVDQVYGGIGNDTLYGGSQERSDNGGFMEVFRGNSGADIIDGAGTDTVVGAAGSDRVNYGNSPAPVSANLTTGTASDGFGFTDTLFNIDQVQGSPFNDTLVGGADNHRLIGDAGNDSLVGGASGVEASYQGATGAVNVSLAIAGPQAVGADQGSDTLTNINDLRGSDFNDTLTGNAAGNRIIGHPGADTIDGGAGTDYASYVSTPLANGGINAFIENGTGLVEDGFGSTDTLTNIEGLIGTHSGDTLAGGLGNQWFIGRGGSDSIDGGAGSDWVSYINDPAGATINLGTGSATDGWGGVWGFGGTDTLVSIENAEGSGFNDTLTGNALANVLSGGAGNDTVFAGEGADTVSGGEGADVLVGHESIFDSVTDVLDGGAGDDTLYAEASDSIQGGAGRDLLYIVNSNPISINVGVAGIEWIQTDFGNDVIDGSTQAVGIEVYADGGNDSITGSAFADIIWSGSGNDTVMGGDGNDVVVADIGVDSVSGGAGNDSLYIDSGDVVNGGAGFDALYVTGGAGVAINLFIAQLEWAADFAGGNDVIDGSGSSVALEVYAAGGTDTVSGGSSADFLWGGSGADTVAGNGGDDTLVGEAGADVLSGGLGIDALYGTSGNGGDGALDRFVFADAWGTDFVFDFENGVDRLDVSAVTGINGFADLTVSNTADGHAYVSFGGDLIAVANASGLIDATDFIL